MMPATKHSRLQACRRGSAKGTTGFRAKRRTRRCQTGGASSYMKHISAFIMSCSRGAFSVPCSAALCSLEGEQED